MTEQEAIKKVCDVAYSQVGYREGENNYNKYAKELDPLGITYGPKQNQPWCGEFKLWCFYKAFGVNAALELLCSPKPTGIPLCADGAKYFKNAGRWSSKPQRGACVFFYYDGGINHTGIVVEATSLTFTTVEGNSSDMVSRRVRTVGDPSVAGFGIPKWSVVADSVPPEVPVEIPVASTTNDIPAIKRGSVGEVVRAAQILLIGRGFTCGSYGADADFGPATEMAVRNFQLAHSLGQDGVVGPQTWAALLGL